MLQTKLLPAPFRRVWIENLEDCCWKGTHSGIFCEIINERLLSEWSWFILDRFCPSKQPEIRFHAHIPKSLFMRQTNSSWRVDRVSHQFVYGFGTRVLPLPPEIVSIPSHTSVHIRTAFNSTKYSAIASRLSRLPGEISPRGEISLSRGVISPFVENGGEISPRRRDLKRLL